MKGRLGAHLELCRVSNLPTVWTDVAVGVLLTGGDAGVARIIGMSVCGSLLYAGGMAMNDAVDAPLDAQSRPERPVPSGRISRTGAAGFASILMAAGVLGSIMISPAAAVPAVLLLACIVGYNTAHKRFKPAWLLMGLCRGLLIVLAARAAGWDGSTTGVWVVAACATLYTTAITIMASGEERDTRSPLRWAAFALPVIPLAPFLSARPDPTLATIAAGTVMVAWLIMCATRAIRDASPMHAILGALAGMCLADAFYIAWARDDLIAVGVCWLCFVLTRLLHRRILGT